MLLEKNLLIINNNKQLLIDLPLPSCNHVLETPGKPIWSPLDIDCKISSAMFCYFSIKSMLWVLIRIASSRRF